MTPIRNAPHIENTYHGKRHEINTSKAPVFFGLMDILHAFDSGSKLIQAYFCLVSSSKIYIRVNFILDSLAAHWQDIKRCKYVY